MVNDDKIKNKIDEGSGQVKETTGRITGDDEMRQEGADQKDTAQLKDKAQDAVSKAKEAVDKAKGMFQR